MIVYTCLVQSCIKNKDINKAIQLFETMKKQKIRPDHIVYSSIINGCLFNRKFESAHKYLIESINFNIKLKGDLYDKFFALILSNYHLRETLKLKYIESSYALLRDKFRLSDETVRKILNYICNVKAISVNHVEFKRKNSD